MNIKKILREEIESAGLLNEAIHGKTQTDYTIRFELLHNEKVELWNFYTELGNNYDLEFFHQEESGNILLQNGLYLYQTVKEQKNIYNIISLGFTVGNLKPEEREDPNIHDKETNNDELFDLIRRINYLVNEFITKNTNIKIYSIGLDTHDVKMKMYLDMFKYNYSDKFEIIEGESSYYYDNSYYFIDKQYLI